jgi:FKBP-type peptidyl-prolyl cis-trans isomerase
MNTSNILRIKDITSGEGEVAILGSHVKVKCVMQLINAGYVGAEEKIFTLEEGGEAAGLVEGIKGMKVGGTRKIEGSANWWYGEDASNLGIPSNVGLVFTVELVSVAN